MKNRLIIFLSVFSLLLAGCKSKKEIAPVEVTPVATAKWQNVSMPVTMTVNQPMNLTLNGTLTMVRGSYALVSFRTFGFEIARVCATPENLDMVVKMPSKMWVSEPLGNRMRSRSIDFTTLQDDLLNPDAAAITIPGLSISSADGVTALSISTTAKGMKLSATVTFDIDDARWDVSNPAAFSTPGSDYRKLSAEAVLKSLK